MRAVLNYTYLPRGVLFQGLLDRDEVLEALGHLEALDVEVARVQEVVNPLSAVVLCFGLVGGQNATERPGDRQPHTK